MTCSERELGDDLLTLAFLEDGGVITNIVINLIVSLLIYLIWMCFNRNKSHSMEMLPLLQDESDSGSQVVRGTSKELILDFCLNFCQIDDVGFREIFEIISIILLCL